MEEGVPLFRASTTVQNRIETLLRKHKDSGLTAEEETELDRYEEIDDYLSGVGWVETHPTLLAANKDSGKNESSALLAQTPANARNIDMKKQPLISSRRKPASRLSSLQPVSHPIAGRKPVIFLASATESKKVLRDVALLVEACGGKPLPRPEAFPVGQYPLESLIEASRKVDGALVLASADDEVIQRGKRGWTPRDNVLLEVGIFVSALSRMRAALVYVAPAEVQIRLPSDLTGCDSKCGACGPGDTLL